MKLEKFHVVRTIENGQEVVHFFYREIDVLHLLPNWTYKRFRLFKNALKYYESLLPPERRKESEIIQAQYSEMQWEILEQDRKQQMW
jgi:hypothetical protein